MEGLGEVSQATADDDLYPIEGLRHLLYETVEKLSGYSSLGLEVRRLFRI